MYVLTPCGDCGGAHNDCGMRPEDECERCGGRMEECADEDGYPVGGLMCPHCDVASEPQPTREYDYSPPVMAVTMKETSMRVGLIDLSAVFRRNWEARQDAALVKTVATIHKYAGESAGRVVVCCDHPPYRRAGKFPQYKAEREKQPAVMYEVQDEVCDRLREDGFRVVSAEGYEADDVIATFAIALCEHHEITVYSSDKDLLQLVGDNVTVVSTATGSVMNRDRVIGKLGVEPNQIPDWLALVGDKSDGITGLPGCGPKTASSWLQRYGDLEGIFTALGELEPERFRKPLLDASKDIQLYRELVTLEVIEGIDTDAILKEPTVSVKSDDSTDRLDAPSPRSLSDKLCRVMLGVKRLKKNGFNDFHKYNFATDGDVSDLIRELLAFNGVEFGVNMVDVERRKIAGRNGERTVTECIFEMTFRSGDEVRKYFWRGEAQDNEDKGINKAATAAVKYFLLKTFLISTGVPDEDADHHRASNGGVGNGNGRGHQNMGAA